MRSRVRSIAIVMTLAGAAAAAPAQLPVVDAGLFTISRNGERVGEEEFTITKLSANALHLRAESRIGSRTATVELWTDSLGVPSQYKSVVSENGARVLEISGVRAANRFQLYTTPTGGGRAYNELLLMPGMVFADDELVSTYAFLSRFGPRAVVAVVPRSWSARQGTLRTVGSESVVIGGSTVAGTHLTLAITGSDDRHELWSTRDGQLLKVEIPARRTVAVRQAPPR